MPETHFYHCRISQFLISNTSSVCHLRLHTHPFNGPLSGTTQVSQYQKGKTNLDFTEARGSEWQWHQLGHMLVCTSLQTDNHASTPPLSFLQAGCPSCSPTNSVKALKAKALKLLTAMHLMYTFWIMPNFMEIGHTITGTRRGRKFYKKPWV